MYLVNEALERQIYLYYTMANIARQSGLFCKNRVDILPFQNYLQFLLQRQNRNLLQYAATERP